MYFTKHKIKLIHKNIFLNHLLLFNLDEQNYQTAQIKMAQIYLEKKRDKQRYVLCYR